MKEAQGSSTVSHRNLYLSVFISEYILSIWQLNCQSYLNNNILDNIAYALHIL